jgi:hypothetical protein
MWTRMSRTAVVALCAVVCLVAAAAALGASPGRGSSLILSPRSGKGVPAPVLIRVQTGRNAKGLKAQLNGHPIARYFSRASHRGVRRLDASLSYGLRPGRNRLHVRVGKRSEWSRFRVWRGRPLAGAGIDRTVAAGARVYLGREPSHTGGSKVEQRWKVVRGSGSGSSSGARLIRARSARPRLVASQPGRYVLRLRVRARDGRTGSDLVDVRADPPPMVPVDTMAFPGNATQSGVDVGGRFYPSKPRSWAQLVTLDRGTLEPVTGKLADLANKAYFCETPWPCPDAQKALSSDLARLNRDDLVIVASPYRTGGGVTGETPFGLESALARIGVSPTGFDQRQDIASPGGISAIGVPGTQPGQGNWRSVPSRDDGAGRMRDYLVRSNEGDYVFSPRDRLEFDTQAPGSDDDQNVIKVGNQSFTQPGKSHGGGLQVVVADRRTLTATSQYFNTGTFGLNERTALADLAALLKRADDGSNLVFIASRGRPAIHSSIADDNANANLKIIANQIEELGGTRNGIFTALDPDLNHHNSYSLVGWSHAGAGQAVETVGGGTKSEFFEGLNSAPLAGTLARTGPNYAFAVESSRSIPPETTGPDPSRGAIELTQVALRPSSEGGWPERGDAGRTAAVKWVGKQVFGTDDPRGQYWTVPFIKDAFDYAYWGDAATRIGKLDYAQGPDFTDADLVWAKAELQREIGWLISAHRYLDNLSTPFAKGQLQSWADFQQIANSIRDKVGVSIDEKIHANSRAVFNGIRALVDVIPGPQAKAVEAANAIYEMVAGLVEINGAPADDDYQARADQLGVTLAERLSAAQGLLDRQLPNVISSDYEKLKAVGECTSSNPQDWANCPFDHGDWQYTQDDQASAAKRLRPQLEVSAYGSLLPAKYTAYQLPLWWRTRVNDDFYGYTAFSHWTPFDGLPDSAQMAKPIYRNIPTYSHKVTGPPWKSSGETWQITALGYLSGEGTIISPWVMHYPAAPVTNPLFRSTADGGLGLDPETFFDVNFTPKSLNHYPERDTPTGWCAEDLVGCGR